MRVDDNPLLGDQNMVDAGLLKGKTKVLTSTNQKKLEQSIPRCKYRSTNIGKLRDVAMSKRDDMSREERQKQG